MCDLFSLQLLSEIFLTLRRTERDRFKNIYWSSCKVTAILVRFEYNLNFLHRFLRNTQISNFMEIHSVGSLLFCVDGQTDRHDEANSHFAQFCEYA
jgi:hypothetical protein